MPNNVAEEAKVALVRPKINVSNMGLKVDVPKVYQTTQKAFIRERSEQITINDQLCKDNSPKLDLKSDTKGVDNLAAGEKYRGKETNGSLGRHFTAPSDPVSPLTAPQPIERDQEEAKIPSSHPTSTNENKILFKIEVTRGTYFYKVQFEYDMLEDTPQKIAEEMQRDLKLKKESIQAIRMQIQNSVEKYEEVTLNKSKKTGT